MNKYKMNRIISPIILSFLFSFKVNCQNTELRTGNYSTDSLSLKDIIEVVIKNHPAIKIAEEAIINADARIGLAKTGYYPQVDMTANYSNMGPVTKLTIPNMGTFQLFPENNYSASINYRQTIYDFGRTKQNVELEVKNKNINEQSLEQVKQKMAMAAVNNFYTLVYLQAALKIKDEELGTLKGHLEQVEKMRSTGSATEYQILSTKVKISGIESQKVDLLAALATQQSFLNSLTGMNEKNIPVVKNELSVMAPYIQEDSFLSYAYLNRDEMHLNIERSSIAGLRYDLAKTMKNPVLNFLATGGAKNGYVPELGKIRPNYLIGLGITIPIFDGMKTKYNLDQAESGINTLLYETEYTKRAVTDEVKEAEEHMKAEAKKISQFELQLSQALKAYSLAETSFSAGTITNLDLLDANTAVSESRLMLLKARIDYATSIYKLKVSIGERLY